VIASAQIRNPDPIHPLAARKFGMLTIINVSAENTGPALPSNLIAGPPRGR
jgi:hypothetical protein